MTSFSTHTSGARVLLAAFAIAVSAASGAIACPRAASPGSYGWPVAPFDRQHPIRGTFGDPRTIFDAPPTRVGLYRGGGSFSFHMGVDISARDGTRVYPVVSGVVSAVSFEKGAEKVAVDSGDGRSFEYWHLHASVRVGERVVARRTVLGRILRTAGHVHLTEIDGGRITNPLLPGHLTPYRGKVVVREQVAWDARTTIPPDAAFWRYYARGTYQNMAVFAPHYSWGQPGSYVFRLATLDTRRLRDDVYRLVVTATDARGNHSSAAQVFSVHNHPGWIGV